MRAVWHWIRSVALLAAALVLAIIVIAAGTTLIIYGLSIHLG